MYSVFPSLIDRRIAGSDWEGQTFAHGPRLGEDPVELRSRRRPGPQFDAEVPTGVVFGPRMLGERARDRLWGSRSR